MSATPSGLATAAAQAPAPRTRLLVPVTAGLTLDAGTAIHEADGRTRVLPAEQTLMDQVLNFLWSQPQPAENQYGTGVTREGAAATAVCLRWGSYWAVLADPSKPLWEVAADPERAAATSRIADAEMMRLNIEISANVARWMDMARSLLARDRVRYNDLVTRAIAYLPLVPNRGRQDPQSPIAALAAVHLTRRFQDLVNPPGGDGPELTKAKEEVAAYPSRVIANTVVNIAWRYGSGIEDVHAGQFAGYPLHQRRVTPKEERTLLESATRGFTTALWCCTPVDVVTPGGWPAVALPFRVFDKGPYVPTGWSLTAETCDMDFRAQ